MMGIVTGVAAHPCGAGRRGPAGGGGGGFGDEFLAQKLVTAHFFATQILPQAAGLAPGGDRRRRPTCSVLSSDGRPSGVQSGISS